VSKTYYCYYCAKKDEAQHKPPIKASEKYLPNKIDPDPTNKGQKSVAKAHTPSASTCSGGRGIMRCLMHERPLKVLVKKMSCESVSSVSP